KVRAMAAPGGGPIWQAVLLCPRRQRHRQRGLELEPEAAARGDRPIRLLGAGLSRSLDGVPAGSVRRERGGQKAAARLERTAGRGRLADDAVHLADGVAVKVRGPEG